MKDDTERKLNSKDIDLKSKYKNLFKCIFKSKNTLLYADHLRFKQIMYNLVDNATKFTNEGMNN